MHDTARRWHRLLFACALATVAPLYTAKYLPISDLPEHVAVMGTLRHWFDPSWHDAQIYSFEGTRSPYLAYHVLGALLSFVTGADLANRLLLTAIGFSLPYAMQSLIVAFGGDRRLALFACPVFWCRPLLIGFLPYMAAVPVTLFALALVARQLDVPTRLRAIGLAALAVLIFYLHLDAFVLLVVVSVALHVVPPRPPIEPLVRRLARLPLRLAWFVPSGLAALTWALRASAEAGPTLIGDGNVKYVPFGVLGREFSAWTYNIWHSHVDEGTGVALWGLVLLLAWHRGVPEPDGARGVFSRWVPFLCTLGLFTLLPFQVGAGAMLNVRLAIFLPLFVLLVLRPDPRRFTTFVLGSVAVLVFVVAINAAVEIRAAAREEVAGFDDLLAHITPGSRLLALQFDRESAHSDFAPWIHMGAYHRTRKGGVASISFADLPHWPVRFRPEMRPPQNKLRFMEFHPCLFRNAYDGPYYDFLLTRGDIDPFRNDPPGPRWRQVMRSQKWTLYEKLLGQDVPPGAAIDEGPCSPNPAI